VNDIINKAAQIKLAVFDVDGVMTDGSLIFSSEGQEFKVFNVHDGLGLFLLNEAGIKTAVITGRKSEIVTKRLEELGFDYIFQGIKDKKQCLQNLCDSTGISANQCSYTGDDLIDIPAFSVAGLSIAVASAHERVKKSADWVTSKRGGQGAVREVCELILEAQGLLEPLCRQLFDS
jgi:3-deoxy-D-manno-octulosonate 8-phosphate phosphatase (KDO 8-P phosphatase)